MSTLVINGPSKLSGELLVAGAKNSAVTALAVCLLSDKVTVAENVPQIEDIKRLGEILEHLGVIINSQGSTYRLDPAGLNYHGELPLDLVAKLRASNLLIGPLLARFGKVEFPHPGGCIIGRRPIDFFLDGFRALGAEVELKEDRYILSAPHGLTGGQYVFPRVSHTGTESLLMAAVISKDRTTIVNAAMEPEVTALGEYLISCGAKISGLGSPVLVIDGIDHLDANTFTVAPDRIEAGSFLAMAAASKSKLIVKGCRPEELQVPITLLQHMGVPLTIKDDSIAVGEWSELDAMSITTHEYPGFPTDLQAPFTVLLTQCTGTALVHETIFEGRLFYVDFLNRMGANITLCDPHRALVSGPTPLRAKYVEGPDIRAGLAMVIAGLVATGTTRIGNAYQIDRGYQNLEGRLRQAGADIARDDS